MVRRPTCYYAWNYTVSVTMELYRSSTIEFYRCCMLTQLGALTGEHRVDRPAHLQCIERVALPGPGGVQRCGDIHAINLLAGRDLARQQLLGERLGRISVDRHENTHRPGLTDSIEPAVGLAKRDRVAVRVLRPDRRAEPDQVIETGLDRRRVGDHDPPALSDHLGIDPGF